MNRRLDLREVCLLQGIFPEIVKLGTLAVSRQEQSQLVAALLNGEMFLSQSAPSLGAGIVAPHSCSSLRERQPVTGGGSDSGKQTPALGLKAADLQKVEKGWGDIDQRRRRGVDHTRVESPRPPEHERHLELPLAQYRSMVEGNVVSLPEFVQGLPMVTHHDDQRRFTVWHHRLEPLDKSFHQRICIGNLRIVALDEGIHVSPGKGIRKSVFLENGPLHIGRLEPTAKGFWRLVGKMGIEQMEPDEEPPTRSIPGPLQGLLHRFATLSLGPIRPIFEVEAKEPETGRDQVLSRHEGSCLVSPIPQGLGQVRDGRIPQRHSVSQRPVGARIEASKHCQVRRIRGGHGTDRGFDPHSCRRELL